MNSFTSVNQIRTTTPVIHHYLQDLISISGEMLVWISIMAILKYCLIIHCQKDLISIPSEKLVLRFLVKIHVCSFCTIHHYIKNLNPNI